MENQEVLKNSDCSEGCAEKEKCIQERAHNARQKILCTALKMFASSGYEKTSTRDIAKEAGVNLSAIKYYFEDKMGLYRAAYLEPIEKFRDKSYSFLEQDTLEKSLFLVFNNMIRILKETENIKLCIKLHMREMLEPTGLWEKELKEEIVPFHNAIVELVKKNIPLIDCHKANKIAFSIMSMSLFLVANYEVINEVDKSLLSNNKKIDLWHKDIVKWSIAIIEKEKQEYENKN